MKKRILSILLAVAVILTALPITFIFADTQEEEIKDYLIKTAEWTDANKNEVKITLESKNASETLADNILFLGSLCGNHELEEDTVIGSVNTAAGKANVDYHLWYSPKTTIAYDPNAKLAKDVRYQFSGSLEKGDKLSETDDKDLFDGLEKLASYRDKGDDRELGAGSHNSLYDFAYSLVEASKSEKKYDFIIMEFDGILLGEYTGGSVDANTKYTGTTKAADLLDEASKFIADFYKEGRVAWIIPKLSSGTFMFHDDKLDGGRSGPTQSEINTRSAIKLLAPEDLNADGSIPSNSKYKYTGKDKNGTKYQILDTFKKRMEAAESSKNRIWVSYDDNTNVSKFLDAKLEGEKYETVIITDTIKKGFKFKSVSGKYKAKTDSASWSDATEKTEHPKFTYKVEQDKDTGEDVVTGTFEGVSTLGHTLVKMEINATLDTANDPFPKTSTKDSESVETNDGDAIAEYKTVDGDIVKSKAKSPTVSKKYYTVTTSATNGTITESNKYVEGSDVTVSYSPNTGYELDYIKVDDEKLSGTALTNSQTSYKFSKIAADHKVEVVYKQNQVTYNYYVRNGSGTVNEKSSHSETVDVYTGNPQGATAAAAKGYNFVNWTDSTGKTVYGTDAFICPTRASKSTPWPGGDYYANFSDNLITINYEAKTGGTVSNSADAGIAAATGNPAGSTAKANPGYTFECWKDANGTVVGTDAKFVPKKNSDNLNFAATYYAYFTENKITINYEAKTGGTVSSASDSNIPAATGNPAGSTAKANPGYTFECWKDANGTVVGTDVKFVPKKNSDNIHFAATYYAYFTENKINIYYKVKNNIGGTVSSASNTNIAAATGNPAGSTATADKGYTFVRWEDASGNTVGSVAAFTPKKNGNGIHFTATYYAVFSENKIPIYYHTNASYAGKVALGGETIYAQKKDETVDAVSGTPKGAKAKANEGYKFKNWTNEEKTVVYGTNEEFKPSKDANDKIYKTAHYYANFYLTVNFVTNGHGTVPSQDIDIGGKATNPKISDDGYEFDGWYESETFEGEPFDFNENVYEPKTLYAKWKVIVEFIDPKGPDTNPEDEEIPTGDKTSEPDPKPETEGYELGGWYEDEQCTVPFDFNKEITEPTKVYAKWIEKTATLTYELNGGKLDEVANGQTMYYTKETDVFGKLPVKDGFRFKGYAKSAEDAKNGKVAYAVGDMVKGKKVVPQDTTLYAVWEEVPTSPVTSDSNSFMLWIALSLIAAAAFICTVALRKKKAC